MKKFKHVPYTLIQDEGKGIERISSTLERHLSRANAIRMEYGCFRSPLLVK